MHIYIGSDHGGQEQKTFLIEGLKDGECVITDCGSYSTEATDYPDFALAVGKAVIADPGSMGILLCRSGEGMEMAANKIAKVRAALVWSAEIAKETRQDNDANVLVLPSDFVSDQDALTITKVFIATEFSGEKRHIRRLEKLHNIENTHYEA